MTAGIEKMIYVCNVTRPNFPTVQRHCATLMISIYPVSSLEFEKSKQKRNFVFFNFQFSHVYVNYSRLQNRKKNFKMNQSIFFSWNSNL